MGSLASLFCHKSSANLWVFDFHLVPGYSYGMRFIFPVLIIASAYIMFSPEKKSDEGILASVLKEENANFQVIPAAPELKFPEVVRTVTEFNQDSARQMIEVRKGYSADNKLVSEESFRDGKQYGLQKYYLDGKLARIRWQYGNKKRDAVFAEFDSEGKVTEAKCMDGDRFAIEIDKACGFEGEFTVKSRSDGSEITRLNGATIASKRFHSHGGTLWLEEKNVDGKLTSFQYRHDGSLQGRSYKNEQGHYSESYNEAGKLESKQQFMNVDGRKFSLLTLVDENGTEIAEWELIPRSEGFGPESCNLRRSIASNPPKPQGCP